MSFYDLGVLDGFFDLLLKVATRCEGTILHPLSKHCDRKRNYEFMSTRL